jgi:hypothetical protein
MAEVILIITGVLFGGFLVWLVLRNAGKEKMDFLAKQAEAYREQNSLKEKEINELNRQNSQKTAELNAMTVDCRSRRQRCSNYARNSTWNLKTLQMKFLMRSQRNLPSKIRKVLATCSTPE